MIKQFLILATKGKLILTTLLGLLLAFLTPVIPLILTILAAILFDTATGIWKSKKLKQKITSKLMSKIISKLFLYEGALILFFVIDKFMMGDFIALFMDIPLVLTKLVAMVFIYIELKSINENIEEVTGKGFWKYLKEMLHRAKDIKEDIKDIGDE